MDGVVQMKIYKMKGFGNEKFYRVCDICRDDRECCNFCRYLPINKLKHQHIFNCTEETFDPNIGFFGKLFGKKEITIIKYCVCGKREEDG